MKSLSNMIRVFCVGMAIMSVTTLYGATAAKGVFSVAANKKVQFANTVVATREDTHNLYQWSEAVAMQGDGWRLLSNDEWSYLLADGRTDAANLNSLGTIDGKNVLIILPDGWVKPAGVPDFSTAYMTEGFGANTYTAATWELMAQSGAVFLPCGGYGHYDNGFVFDGDETDHGTFWTSTPNGEDKAYCMRFDDQIIHDQNFDPDKTTYRSVILVREVTVTELNENDEQSAFNTKIEQARGKNFAYVRRMLWKDGYLNTLCLPFDVNNIEASPLAGAQVYTFSGATVQNNIMQLDLTQVTDGKLLQGVPYFLRWTGTDGKIELLHFYDVTTWDDDKEAGTDPGTDVKCHGFYYKSHIGDIKEDTEKEGIHTHYNFFLWSNDEIHWPSDGDDPAAKMKGFRAHFYIDGKGGQSQGNVDYTPGMPAKLRIHNAFGGTTGIEETENGQRKAEKILRNGQLYILYNGQMYNVQGQLVADN